MKTYSILFNNGKEARISVDGLNEEKFSNSVNLDHLGWETFNQPDGTTIAFNMQNAVFVQEIKEQPQPQKERTNE